MNTFHDLLDKYATRDRLRVNAREWLLLLELDPQTAGHAMTQLAILAAEDLTLDLAATAREALTAAGLRADADPAATATALADLDTFTTRIADARQRADAAWAHLRTLLTDAAVLIPVTATTVSAPPRTWIDGWVRLPGVGAGYRASIATRRQQAGHPIVRFDPQTCAQIAADITAARDGDPHHYGPAHHLPAAILADADQPALVIGADSLEHAWTADAPVLRPDHDGLYHLGRNWPWQIDRNHITTAGNPGAAVANRRKPTTVRIRHTARLLPAATA